MSNEDTENAIMKELEEIEDLEEIHVPLLSHFGMHIVSFVIPLYIPLLLLIFYPNIMSFLSLDTFFGLTSSNLWGIDHFWLAIFFPLYFLALMVMYIGGVVLISKGFEIQWHKKSPPVQGTFQRHFKKGEIGGTSSDIIKYYHYRGFIIKYPMWIAYKSPFPWIVNWVLRVVGHNKIDKSAQYIEAFPCLEFCELEKDVVVYPGSVISSHIVDGIFGKLTIQEVKVEENATVHTSGAFAPGMVIGKDYVMLPYSMAPKDWRGTGENKFYSGASAKAIDEKYAGIFSRLPNDAEEIYKEKGFISGEEIDKIINQK